MNPSVRLLGEAPAPLSPAAPRFLPGDPGHLLVADRSPLGVQGTPTVVQPQEEIAVGGAGESLRSPSERAAETTGR